MNKQHILDEIRRTSEANGGVPLGRSRFFKETGVKEYDCGKYWARWNDALREAGFAPNKLQGAYEEAVLIEKYIDLTRELGQLPVQGELRLRRQTDPSFPNDKTFQRFGSKSELISKVVEYCRSHSGFDDVLVLVPADSPLDSRPPEQKASPEEVGVVYRMKSGRHYKIGKPNAIGRREYELAIQLPTKARTVHFIRTDDPGGIEAYWHTRFAAKRTNGEWFELDASDVSAFRRRKFM